MAAWSLKSLFGKLKRDPWTNGANHVRCGYCGRYAKGSDTGKVLCRECDEVRVVCPDHKGFSDKCLECCTLKDPCAVCGDVVREGYANSVSCGGCEAPMLVCLDHLAAPVCKNCTA